ncbi:MAG: TraR/DksA C4-type zinc finger protein [bacterium]
MKNDTYKARLEEEKKMLEGELSSMGKLDNSTGEWMAAPEAQTAPEADENDLADRSEDFEGRSGATDVLGTRLEDINLALGKIANSSYGMCEVCNNPIEDDRLEANPAARTCKGCMDK